MTTFFVGHCPDCGVVLAAAIKQYADKGTIADMVESGLVVKTEEHKQVALSLNGCGCKIRRTK